MSHLGKGFPKGKWVYDKFMPGHVGKVWFDQIVVATDYIGPIAK